MANAITRPAANSTAITTERPTDWQALAGLWVFGRSAHTQRAYLADVGRLYRFLDGKPLDAITLQDLQGFAQSLQDLAPATQARILAAVKSLLSFGHKLGYLPANVGAPLPLPKRPNTLAKRILPEATVHKMLALELNPRNHALLRLLYASGIRAAEACSLTWGDVQVYSGEKTGGAITVTGKGSKTRTVYLPVGVINELVALRRGAGDTEPVFRSRRGGALNVSQVFRIVQAAARRAGVTANVSPHWLRHAHASHALDRGAPVHLVQATLGHASVATTGRYLHARPDTSSSTYLAV